MGNIYDTYLLKLAMLTRKSSAGKVLGRVGFMSIFSRKNIIIWSHVARHVSRVLLFCFILNQPYTYNISDRFKL